MVHSKKKRICPHCDNETVNIKFCDFCGKPIQEEDKKEKAPHCFEESNTYDPTGHW